MDAVDPSRAPSDCRPLHPGAFRADRASWSCALSSDFRDLLRKRGGCFTGRRRSGRYVALERELRSRRFLERRTAQRIILAQRMAFPIDRHLDAPQIGMPFESDSKKIVYFAFRPIRARPNVR